MHIPRTVALILAAGCVLPMLAQPSVDSLYGGMRWRQIGPFRAGRVSAVAGVPGDAAVYYMGTPGGGVWKTVDGGVVWTPIFDQEHVASIGAIAALNDQLRKQNMNPLAASALPVPEACR